MLLLYVPDIPFFVDYVLIKMDIFVIIWTPNNCVNINIGLIDEFRIGKGYSCVFGSKSPSIKCTSHISLL